MKFYHGVLNGLAVETAVALLILTVLRITGVI
jgi:hypothetical protein